MTSVLVVSASGTLQLLRIYASLVTLVLCRVLVSYVFFVLVYIEQHLRSRRRKRWQTCEMQSTTLIRH